jgi:sarcosine/dimethylglycine N-methyltransferase
MGPAGEEGIGTVVRFYETHPINERQILGRLEAAGVTLGGLTEDVLQDHDQDHFGGLAAVDELARRAGIGPGSRVLDVCSGVGGPARYLAHRYGCRVTGLDVTESRHEAAVRLTRLVGLDHAVEFRLGNALAMPFADGAFDVVIGQEAWAHVPDKPRLVSRTRSSFQSWASWTARVRAQKRWIAARMSSADFVQRKGFGSAFVAAM